MDSKTETFVHLIMAIVIMLAISVAAYFAGCKMAEMFILPDAQALGKKIPMGVDWEVEYRYLVLNMGIIAGVILIIWTILTHCVLRTSDSAGISKRWIWALLGIILAVICVFFPGIYVEANHLSGLLVIDNSIPLLFLVCYCLAGYWGGSIFVTSETYKYTPLFAGFFHTGD